MLASELENFGFLVDVNLELIRQTVNADLAPGVDRVIGKHSPISCWFMEMQARLWRHSADMLRLVIWEADCACTSCTITVRKVRTRERST